MAYIDNEVNKSSTQYWDRVALDVTQDIVFEDGILESKAEWFSMSLDVAAAALTTAFQTNS